MISQHSSSPWILLLAWSSCKLFEAQEPVEASEFICIQCFGKYAGDIVMSIDVRKGDFIWLNVFMKEGMLDVNVFDVIMQCGILRKVDGSIFITANCRRDRDCVVNAVEKWSKPDALFRGFEGGGIFSFAGGSSNSFLFSGLPWYNTWSQRVCMTSYALSCVKAVCPVRVCETQ